jgi:hypothetical protein
MTNANQDLSSSQSYDAQQQAEDIAQGNQLAQRVNVDVDYEASKAYSQSEIDQQQQGAEAADAATQSALKPHSAEETKLEEPTTGSSDPAAYREMAKDLASESGRLDQ